MVKGFSFGFILIKGYCSHAQYFDSTPNHNTQKSHTFFTIYYRNINMKWGQSVPETRTKFKTKTDFIIYIRNSVVCERNTILLIFIHGIYIIYEIRHPNLSEKEQKRKFRSLITVAGSADSKWEHYSVAMYVYHTNVCVQCVYTITKHTCFRLCSMRMHTHSMFHYKCYIFHKRKKVLVFSFKLSF